MEDVNGSLERLGREVAGALAVLETDARADADDRRDFLAKAAPRARSAVSRRSVGLAFAILACAGVFVWTRRPSEDLLPSFSVGSPSRVARVGELLEAGPSVSVPIAFEEGSRLHLAPRTRASVDRLEATRRKVTLHDGEAHAAIRSGQRIAWEFAAGPFVVHVTGTRFRLVWREEARRLRLVMEEGSVRINGPCLDEPRTLASRETLEVRCPSQEAVVDAEVAADPTPATSTHAEPSTRAVHAPANHPSRSASEKTKALVPRPNFASLVAVGRYAEAVALVEGAGFDEACLRYTARELVALGDAARLSRRDDLAQQAFLAVRARFPRSFAAADAAYGLARLALDVRSDCTSASPWLERYLTERKSGALRSEALGRLLECALRGGSPARARHLAEEYLRAEPQGPYEDLARATLAR